MILAEVERLLGTAGKKKGTMTAPSGQERVLYEWRSADGVTVKTTFLDGFLSEWKVQK